MTRTQHSETVTLRGFFTTTPGLLALGILLVDLVSGIQMFSAMTLTPFIAADLKGQHLYGWFASLPQACLFLTIPLGTLLLRYMKVQRIFWYFTAVTCVGAVISALAPSMEVLFLGLIFRALAGGVLLSVGINSITSLLPRQWRQTVMALFSLTILLSAIVGPIYASWIFSSLGWRWAMVLYLPFLLIGRALVGKQISKFPTSSFDVPKASAVRGILISSVVLSTGSLMLSLANEINWWRLLLAGIGLAGMLWAANRLLVPGSLTFRRGMPAMVLLKFLVAGAFFGVDSVIGIIGHDFFGYGIFEVSTLLTVSGITFALTGMYAGRFSSKRRRQFIGRMSLGIALLILGMVLIVIAFAKGAYFPILLAGWGLCGFAGGLVEIDLTNKILDTPESKTVEGGKMSTTLAMIDSLAIAIFGTIASSFVAIFTVSNQAHQGGGAPGGSALGTMVGLSVVIGGIAVLILCFEVLRRSLIGSGLFLPSGELAATNAAAASMPPAHRPADSTMTIPIRIISPEMFAAQPHNRQENDSD